MTLHRSLTISFLFLFFPFLAIAGTFSNPTIALNVRNKPIVDMSKIKTVAILPIQNIPGQTCGDEVSDKLEEALKERQGIEIVNRSQLQSVLGELNFQGSGMVDSATIAKLGQIAPGGAFIYGTIKRGCVAEAQHTDPNAGLLGYNEAEMDIEVVASITMVDIETTKTILTSVYTGKGQAKTNAWLGKNAKIDTNAALSKAEDSVVTQFVGDWEEWDKTLPLTVYDDSKWGLKAGSVSLLAGHYEDAVNQFTSALKQYGGTSTDSKMLAKANYNLGLALIFAGRAKDAVRYLRKSLDDHASDDAQTAYSWAGRLSQGNVQLILPDGTATVSSYPTETGSVPQPSASQSGNPAPQPAVAAQQQTSSVMNNDKVIQMVKLGLSDELINTAIDQESQVDFDLSTNGMIQLAQQKVGNAVIAHMKQVSSKKAVKRTTAATHTAAPEQPKASPSPVPTPPPPETPKVQPPASEPANKVPDILTNDDIIAMVKSGVPQSKIEATIDAAKSVKFEMTSDKVNLLMKNGVSSDVINHMSQARKRAAATTP